MMITDEPDEDADTLEDSKLLESYLESEAGARSAPMLPDWPGPGVQESWLAIDPATRSWFQSRHQDWRREMRCVLRAWIKAHDTMTA